MDKWYEHWYFIVLLILAILVVLAILFFIIYYLISLKRKKSQDNKLQDFYKNIIASMGGINNIDDVIINNSRLSLIIKNNSLINQNLLQELVNNGIGIVKSSKKITLVIGKLADKYGKSILAEIKKTH